MRTSIQKIKRIYETGQWPVLVECDDLNEYVCKHNRGQSPCYTLFAEWFAHEMLLQLGTRTAQRAFVKIKEEHVEASGTCQPIFFKDLPCFGTRYLEESLEWSQFKFSANDLKNINNPEDILRIAFCDLWLANEDRNWNNFNLLLNPEKKGYDIVPIDHGACFNTLSFAPERELFQLNYNETLIATEHFCNLVKTLVKNMKHTGEFAEMLYIRVRELESIYDEKVLAIPIEWKIPEPYLKALKSSLFSKDWLDVTKTSYLSFIKTSLNLK